MACGGAGGVKRGYGADVAETFSRRIGYCLELHNQSVKVGFRVILYRQFVAHHNP